MPLYLQMSTHPFARRLRLRRFPAAPKGGVVWLSVLLVFFPLLMVFQLQTPTPSPTLTPTPFFEPEGCERPPDDYRHVEVNGQILNQRTLAMLANAGNLYKGKIDFVDTAVMQGSYTGGAVSLSFGTHDGGGAVDISVRNIPGDWSILWDDIPLVLKALRTAGFAAWYRDESDGMTPHIHAIAIGDGELSRAARLQLLGRYGYFRGYDGLPQADGVPQPDASGDPILCGWMLDLGYRDMRGETETATPPYNYVAGENYLINTTWGDELNLRQSPFIGANIIMRLPAETPVILIDGPQMNNGYHWWEIALEDGTQGWVVGSYDNVITLVN